MARRTTSSPGSLPTILRYGIAILSAAIATALGLLLRPYQMNLTPFLLAVGAAVWYGGAGPGVVAIVLSILSLDYFFVSPSYSLSKVNDAGLIYLVFCTLFALIVGWVAETRRRAEQELRRAHDELDVNVAKRTAELQRSEGYLQEAQRLNRTGSWAWNVAAREIAHCSQEIYRLYGFDPKNGLPPFEAILQRIHPQDRNRLVETLETAIREQTNHEIVFRAVLPDGTIKQVHDVGHPVLNASGDVVELIGASMDVTQHGQAEEERQSHLNFLQSLDRVNRAIQGSNDIEQMMSDVLDTVLSTFDCDRTWLVFPCDSEASSWRVQMEHTRPDCPGASALGADLPTDAEVANVFRAARACDGTVRFGPGSANPVPALLAERFRIQSLMGMAIYPKVGQPYMFVLHQGSCPRVWTAPEERLFREIGRRMADALTSLLMLHNLRDSEARLEEAQRIAHVGYWERDLDTDSITWSAESCRIFGLDPETGPVAFGRYRQLVHADDRQRVVAAVMEALRGGARYDVEYRVVRSDGEMRTVHSQGDVTRDESGRPRRMFGIVEDITERVQASEALREAHTELAHVNRVTTMGQLAASIAHEINQPIAATITNAYAALRWLDRQHPDLGEARQALEDIIKNGSRAGDVIGRIRALIKKLPPRNDLLDINVAILDVVELTRNEILRNGISLQTELSKGLPPIRGDRIQLQQVMLNLIVNAIEATSGAHEEARQLVISTGKDAADAILVGVRDSGPGLEPDVLSRLFDPFYTTKPAGMGMGLSICRSIIEAHGGRISAGANAPRGAVFHFTLPT